MDDALYLGDGVYVKWDAEKLMIKLWTSNGITETNVIWLDQYVWDALKKYADNIGK